MSEVEVRLSSAAKKAYENLARSDRRLFRRVDKSLDHLAVEPQAGKPLHGPLADHRSLRIGSVRVVYRFDAGELLVLVL